MARKDEVILDDVRAAADRLRNEYPGRDISARDVLDILGRGSTGAINALLREVKIEWIRAEKYQYLDLSPMLRACIFAEVTHAERGAENAARQECAVTEYHFKKIVEANQAAEQRIASLEAELSKVRMDSTEQISKVKADLAETRGRLAISEEVRSNLAATLQKDRHELEAKIAVLQDRLKKAQTRAAIARHSGQGRTKSCNHPPAPTLFGT